MRGEHDTALCVLAGANKYARFIYTRFALHDHLIKMYRDYIVTQEDTRDIFNVLVMERFIFD